MSKSCKSTAASKEEFEAALKYAGINKTEFSLLANVHRGTVVRWNKTGVPRNMLTWVLLFGASGRETKSMIADVARVPSNHMPAVLRA